MTWSNRVSLDVANIIFAPISVQIIKIEIEGGYVATSPTRTMRRLTLMACCISVMSDWVMLRND
ncbi:MAG: hypothetical protein H0X31_06825 [Nostocaceae cyanobacterium]|nr:hypothetical protein [Nostocaceae cyanobacterium]